jgi:fibronectin-binding autotransporter adhesin
VSQSWPRVALFALGGLLVLIALAAVPAGASAASCPVNPGNSTSWLGGNGNLGEENWSNGTPTSSCDVSITAAGDYTVTMTSGANMRSLTLGGTGSTPHLVISDQSPNTNLDAQPAGITIAAGATVTLTCPAPTGGCGPHIYSGSSPFANAGVITVDSNTAGGAQVGGVIANTGTITFEKSGSLSGQVTNKGSIAVKDGATATNAGSSCGGTGPKVVNDTGGSIDAAGNGTLSVNNYEQGNGTTSGSIPVQIPCGTLKYTGTGASTVQASGSMTGNLAAGQTLRILGQVNTPSFANAGTIVFDQSTQDATLSGGTVTNTGKIEVSGPSAHTAELAGGQIQQAGAGAEVVVPAGTKLNPGGMLTLSAGTLRGGGTVSGNVGNSGGTVKPGDGGIGTLTVTGSYVQDVARLEIEIAGTGAGQHDVLAVGGVLGINGTLALLPTSAFAGSAAIGDSVPFLSYNDFGLGGQFAQTTVDPALPCGKVFSTSVDEGAKQLKANVVAGNPCASGGGTVQPPPASPPATPKRICPKGKKLQKGKCVRKKCPKGKKLKRGRCVQKQKARSKRS